MATFAVFGTLDTKGAAHQFLAERIRGRGHTAILLDASLRSAGVEKADVSRLQLLSRASVEAPDGLDRMRAAEVMGGAVGLTLQNLFAEKRLDGVVCAGGKCGLRLALEAIRHLPFGVPCVLVTHAPVEAAEFVRAGREATLLRCALRLDRLNRVSRPLLARAAGAICGMAEFGALAKWMANKPLLVANREARAGGGFERARHILERAGYDVVVFGNGHGDGRALESAVAGGTATGVLDLSLSDLAPGILWGTEDGGLERLEAAGRRGLPVVVAPGGMDAVSIEKPIPVRYQNRVFLETEEGLWMRTSAAECREMGKFVAQRLNRHLGPVTVCLPVKGLSALSGPGQPFQDAAADGALFEGLESSLRKGVRVIRVKSTSGETPFTEACARALLANIKRREGDLKALREVVFFRDAPELAVREAARVMEAFSFAAQEWVAPPKGEPDGLYLVVEGGIEVLENEKIVSRLGPGSRFGELELVFGRTRSVRLRATVDSEVLFLGRDSFECLSVQHPELDELMEAILKDRLWS